MFKNKALQLKVIDANRPNPPQLNDSPNSLETRILEVVKESTTYIAGLFIVYMTVDTLRQIAVHTAVTKIK